MTRRPKTRLLTYGFTSYLQAPSNRSLRLPTVAELSKAELNELVEEAVMDAHDRDEGMSGFFIT